MILITVTGQTFPIRGSLNDAGFWWNSDETSWSQAVTEVSLNKTLESIRPPVSWSDMPSPKIFVELKSVGVNGESLRDGKMRIELKSVGEKGGVDFLESFYAEIQMVQVITPAPPSPKTEKKKKEREVEMIDEGFF